MKKETAEKLSLFRRQQEEADRALLKQVNDTEETSDLVAGDSQGAVNAWKKRKRVEKELIKGVKLRKGSSSTEPSETASGEVHHTQGRPEEATQAKPRPGSAVGEKPGSYPKSVDDKDEKTLLSPKDKATQPSLGLAAYSSDEDG